MNMYVVQWEAVTMPGTPSRIAAKPRVQLHLLPSLCWTTIASPPKSGALESFRIE